MLSCRVQGRMLEQAFFRHLTGDVAGPEAASLWIAFRATPRNGALARVLAALGFAPAEGGLLLALPAASLDGDLVDVEAIGDAGAKPTARRNPGAERWRERPAGSSGRRRRASGRRHGADPLQVHLPLQLAPAARAAGADGLVVSDPLRLPRAAEDDHQQGDRQPGLPQELRRLRARPDPLPVRAVLRLPRPGRDQRRLQVLHQRLQGPAVRAHAAPAPLPDVRPGAALSRSRTSAAPPRAS